MNLKYSLGLMASIPLLPIMYFQGKRIHKKVPRLPNAEGTIGEIVSSKYNKNLKILAIGESTFAGVGVHTHEDGFTGSLGRELSKLFKTNVHWKVYAESGFTTKKVLDEILPSIKEKDIDLLVLGIGGNDAFELNSPYKFKKAARSLIIQLKIMFPDTLIVFCSMPPVKEFPAFPMLLKFTIGNLVEIIGEELNDVASEFENVYYHNDVISMKNWNKRFGLKGDPSDYFSDGVHPSKLAYQIWAKDLALAIRNEEIPKKALHNWL